MREIFARASITRISMFRLHQFPFRFPPLYRRIQFFHLGLRRVSIFSFNITSILDSLFLVLMSNSDVASSKIVLASPISFVITPLLAPRVARSRGRSSSVILSVVISSHTLGAIL